MKKRLGITALLLLSVLVILAACGKSTTTPTNTAEAGKTATAKKINAAYFVNGTLGDKGFFDSAQRGVKQAIETLGMEVKTVEGGTNQADWPAGLESLASSKKYDVIVLGTSQMTDILKDVAKRYDKQKFIFFDEAITGIPNVYSMTYSQNEGSFMAGAFAALVTTSTELKGANPEKVIGFIGGMDIPIINDFKAGYEQGAKYVDPAITVVSSYVGDFANAPKGKELALAQYNSQKVDIAFNVAGGAGLGLLEAGNSLGKYSIGVDSNQNGLYPGSVLTSMVKSIDNSVLRALTLYSQDRLGFGKNEVLGIKEGGVGLAKDDLYNKNVPKAIQDKIMDIEQKLNKGEIKVQTTLK
ncbi:BMP family ABC transporter substrate-binding protein [Paenibacillus marchantiophytorum]|uniref:BMP family ABC transporter substrate-binding protein n=1 Tax=Paenibacillus marchantiophytorum TaxID=1619310 RepID=A0ABQ1ESJ7_9BACL|nr:MULTISPECIES: BMP family ABC transporter substrate-binding protein [Paenibacillus]UKS25828.1 BMP family ABC transporter substrate-binding protein [Paenibacillus sp. HWE-109]GFZ84717.1 BMP family ABC transporter substrate-binding protein [Paenibacillus marchantiophytorum]